MKSVLVIDDDESLRLLLERILEKKYKVTFSSSALEAFCWLTDGNFPDVILTDINMPTISCIELIENLNQSGLFKDIPVIVLSGFDDAEDKERCKELGIHAYLAKPFTPDYLFRIIDDAINATPELNAKSYA